jgi:CBS domain containing-hemolysin-like protein
MGGLSVTTSLILLGALVAASGFFSGVETAVISANRARLQNLADAGRRDARAALRLVEEATRTIATAVVGSNFANIGAASLATALAVRVSPEHGPAIATVLLTPVVLFFGEILPKAAVRAHPTDALRLFADSVRAATALFRPFLFLLFLATRGLLRLLPIPEVETRPVFRRADLENLFLFGVARDESPGAAPGARDDAALRMAGKALDLAKRTVRHAMVPLLPERCCPATASVADAKERFRATRGRYLAVLDRAGQVAGFVAAKALLGERDDRPLAELVRPAYVLDLDDSLDEVMRAFRSQHQAIGLVRDAHGHTLGIVTAEDVFEEVVGELRRAAAGAGTRQEKQH